jgi:hypothetical protein
MSMLHHTVAYVVVFVRLLIRLLQNCNYGFIGGKQDRQGKYNVTLSGVRATIIVVGKSISITYSETKRVFSPMTRLKRFSCLTTAS